MKPERPLLLRDVALWIALAVLGFALYSERRKVPEEERDVISFAHSAATASESSVADWIIQRCDTKDVERDARDAIKDLDRKEQERKRRER